MNMATKLIQVVMATLLLLQWCGAEDCGSQAGNLVCPNNLCCSQFGFCGNTSEYCAPGCQSGPCDCETCQTGASSLFPGTLSGQATYYTGFLPSKCYGDATNQYFAAGGAGMWDGGKNCGKWFKIKCTGEGCISSQHISVKIIDLCDQRCADGLAVDLSHVAFKALANPDVGVITVHYSGPYDLP